MFIDILKQYLRPSSPSTTLIVLMVALVAIYLRPASRWSRRLLLTLVVGFWLISTRLGAETLVWGLGHGYMALQSPDAAQGSQAVVVLGGGAFTYSAADQIVGVLGSSSILRVLEGARVAKMIGARLVVASGGRPYPKLQLKPESEMIRMLLIGSGVAADRIVEESDSKTTRDQARLIGDILRARGIGRFVLVTSPTHMGRSLAIFRAEGLDPVPSVSLMRSTHLPPPSWVVPSDESLSESDAAIYDYAAFAYYWWRGWLPQARA